MSAATFTYLGSGMSLYQAGAVFELRWVDVETGRDMALTLPVGVVINLVLCLEKLVRTEREQRSGVAREL